MNSALRTMHDAPPQAFVAERSPMQRIAKPEDTAEMVVGVLQSRFVTGQVVVVDGGYSLKN